MYKIAIIEEIHKDGLELLEKHPNFEYELINDVSEKNLIERTLGSQLDLPSHAWKKLNFLWIGNFIVVGALNIFVALNFSESLWVSYKLYSAIGFTLLLVTLTIIIVSPHLAKENKSDTNSGG